MFSYYVTVACDCCNELWGHWHWASFSSSALPWKAGPPWSSYKMSGRVQKLFKTAAAFSSLSLPSILWWELMISTAASLSAPPEEGRGLSWKAAHAPSVTARALLPLLLLMFTWLVLYKVEWSCTIQYLPFLNICLIHLLMDFKSYLLYICSWDCCLPKSWCGICFTLRHLGYFTSLCFLSLVLKAFSSKNRSKIKYKGDLQERLGETFYQGL